MTDQQKLKAFKTFDIINPVSLVSGADFCYIPKLFALLNILCYAHGICKSCKVVILANKHNLGNASNLFLD